MCYQLLLIGDKMVKRLEINQVDFKGEIVSDPGEQSKYDAGLPSNLKKVKMYCVKLNIVKMR